MTKLFLLFSHKLTDEQKNDAYKSLKVDEIIILPDNLKNMWGNVSPEGDLSEEYLKPFKDFILSNLGDKNYILIQGEFGVTYKMINWSLNNKFIPIYSTTKREVMEKINDKGEAVKTSFFKHIRFRKYS